MSCCSFIIIEEGKTYFIVNHYSAISEILKNNSPKGFRSNNLNYYEANDSDTGLIPAAIIDFDTKTFTNTSYNWFDDYKKYLSKGWVFIEFRAEICNKCGYILCKNHNNCMKGGIKE